MSFEKLYKPPRTAEWLLYRMSVYESNYCSTGDLEEEYHKIGEDNGYLKAKYWYWAQVLHSILPYFYHLSYWKAVMVNNYFKTAFRTICKYRVYSFINISGLAIGMACCFLMLLWVQDELSFDRFHKNADDIYRIINIAPNRKYVICPAALGPTLEEKFPEIVKSVRTSPSNDILLNYKENSVISKISLVDQSFFEVFSFSILKGNREAVLTKPNSIVLTESLARKLFGSENPIRKTIQINNNQDYHVTGIIENLPANSHIQFQGLIPLEFGISENFKGWYYSSWMTYFQILPNTSITELKNKINIFLHEHRKDDGLNYDLQPLNKIHLYSSNYQWDSAVKGDIKYIIIFIMAALVVLLIACVNFMNISTARAATRANEVSMRKVIGATCNDLIRQFLGESVLLSFIAAIISIAIVILILPIFNNLSGKVFNLSAFFSPDFFIWLIFLVLITGLSAGLYPTLILSYIQPVSIFKDLVNIKLTFSKFSNIFRKISLRRFLIILQFSLMIIFIIATLIISRQLNYILNYPLGFEKEHIIHFYTIKDFQKNYEAIKNELKKHPDIIDVTIGYVPYRIGSGVVPDIEGEKPKEKILMYCDGIDYNFKDFFEIDLIEGRFFSKDFPSDTLNFVINEAAKKVIGFESPIGKTMEIDKYKGKIVGVINDFHFRSLHHAVEPFVFSIKTKNYREFSIKIKSDNIQNTLLFLQKKWMEFAPNYPFHYNFLDKTIEYRYFNEKKISKLFYYFTILTISIACLGLFGLASFLIEQRTSELAIRKFLGASITRLVLLLSREFALWLIVANALAWPIAFYFISKWLQGFAVRTPVNLNVFLLATFLSIIISILSISYQVIKAVRLNPVDSIRHE